RLRAAVVLVQVADLNLHEYPLRGGRVGCSAATPTESLVFSPKGWEPSAQGGAKRSPGYPSTPTVQPEGLRESATQPPAFSQPFGLECSPARLPRAAPWAEGSQPFGLKTTANDGAAPSRAQAGGNRENVRPSVLSPALTRRRPPAGCRTRPTGPGGPTPPAGRRRRTGRRP